MKQFFSRFSLRSVVIMFCLPAFLLIFIVCIVFYKTGSVSFFNIINKNAVTLITQTRDSINDSIESIYYQTSSITHSNSFNRLLRNINNNKEAISPSDYLDLYKTFSNFTEHNPTSIDSLGLYLADNSINLYLSNNVQHVVNVDFDFNYYYNKYIPYNLNWLKSSEEYPYNSIYGDSPNYSLIQIIGNPISEQKGFFLAGINDEVFISRIRNCRLTENSCVTIVQNGNIIFKDSEIFGNSTLENLDSAIEVQLYEKISKNRTSDPISFNLDSYFAVYMPIALEKSGILAIIPSNEMLLDYNSFTHTMISIGIVIIFICIMLYIFITRIISTPIINLSRQLERIDADTLSTPVAVSGSKEIHQIGASINVLLNRISLLMSSLQSEMQAKQTTQLQALHSQINPHFMYNALDAIKQLCELDETSKAEQMIDQLAMYYRIGVSKGKDIISLKDELTHTDMYLSILKTRFEDFHYVINLPKELYNASIIKITLQPIVENALYHGIRPCRTDGLITIDAERINNDIYIHVKDNGGGISDDILSSINSSLSAQTYDFSDLKNQSIKIYGIKNVHDRIRLTYGNGYGLSVQSALDEGTCVLIKIPYIEEDKHID